MHFFEKTSQVVFDKVEIQKKMKGFRKNTKEYKELELELKKNNKKWDDLVNNR